jgi:hypothetical protein
MFSIKYFFDKNDFNSFSLTSLQKNLKDFHEDERVVTQREKLRANE